MLASTVLLGLIAAVSAAVLNSHPIHKAFVIQLAPGANSVSRDQDPADQVSHFHKRATALQYSVRHEFKNSDVFLGLSIQATGNETLEDIRATLHDIEGVIAVTPVYEAHNPQNLSQPVSGEPLSYANPPALVPVNGSGNLGSATQMGQVDKLHRLGIKGKGIKIGVVDTGVDYRHPALGGGFGAGYKIAGGYSFVHDNGTLGQSPDPLATCFSGGHGTHVAGIIGMGPVPGGFDVIGVAPEASIFMYRVFDCAGTAGSDTIMAAMAKAYEDGVDIVSMSLGIGPASFHGDPDPLAAITKTLTDAGIAVVIAQGNDANGSSKSISELYSEEWPSSEPTAISVGAIANLDFPLVYSAVDSSGANLQYASVYPLDSPDGMDVFVLDDGCSSSDWDDALSTISNINETIIAFQVSHFGCQNVDVANMWSSSLVKPVQIMGLNTDSPPYFSNYDTPSQGFFGTVQYIKLNTADGQTLLNNYQTAGGYQKYKVKFNGKDYHSASQTSGGFMDYYSSYGPTWHFYDMKPQISAPGGSILSTWPMGPLGNYVVLSGTSMATPYIAASYALVKSQFPNESIQEILSRLQTNASPRPWIFDKSIIASTAQQGAGMVNVYGAIFSSSTVFPGQLKITDVSKTVYGAANISIFNTSPTSRTYTVSHEGAGYMDYYLGYGEANQQAMYGTATFAASTFTIPAGRSYNLEFNISPPPGVVPSNLPVFGGFVKVADSEGDTFSVPYIGPPYSLYNTPYIFTQSGEDSARLPSVFVENDSGATYDNDFMELNASSEFVNSMPTLQWTQGIRIDLLPANTSIVPNHYGFNTSYTHTYQPPSTTPRSSVFGYSSFGTVLNETGFIWPGGNSPFGRSTQIMGSDGVPYGVGNGDYRLFASVLRWGGDVDKMEDHDTWLGPILRFIGSEVS